ncbi:fibronectin type III domain-containing protein [Fulvivirgaceae bacterium BMA10]|uniref:Fibronectin type III domain-containing protein n=1 Tax=Splendidivirga corallicola TaxID=3051826 RepID=A0ABT8KW66_9BACT|nr:fibronectin type III domain-containing protein [Fulvivirgaceae bacterium BMA10]
MKNVLNKHYLNQIFVVLAIFTILGACSNDDEPKPAALSTPALNNASGITKNSFKISWGKVTNADKYYLDVSEKKDFSTTVSGFKAKAITGTSTTVSGLKANTKYYVRVVAGKGTARSKTSSAKEVTTIK